MTEILTLFETRKNVRELFSWRWEELRDFLVEVSTSPETYTGTPPATLRHACRLIIDFDYSQQSRYFMRRSTSNPPKVELNPATWSWHGKDVPFYSVFSVLGYIVSVISPRPPGAEGRNFYLPLLAVYTRWCLVLSGAEQTFLPSRTFITWLPGLASAAGELVVGSADDSQEHVHPAMGSNLLSPLELKAHIQKLLVSWMSRTYKIDLPTDTSQIRKVPDDDGPLFGHCAESVPLALKIKSVHAERRADLWGICLGVDGVKNLTSYSTTGLIKCISDPCLNCQWIMTKMGANRKNFMKHYIALQIDPSLVQTSKRSKKGKDTGKK